MKIEFSKYHGTGNDFVLIDDCERIFPEKNIKLIQQICSRNFGVGADGLMLLRTAKGYDFEMIYFNADGKTSSMCGNGGRCITAFAKEIGVIQDNAYFTAIDGAHVAAIDNSGIVALKMNDVKSVVKNTLGDFILDTGSPHYVKQVDNVVIEDFIQQAKKIRYSALYKAKGINVNFVASNNKKIMMRTYERGVENETLSCGTGTVAVAIALHKAGMKKSAKPVKIVAPGGNLEVQFTPDNKSGYQNVWLIGNAVKVFEGILSI